MFRLVAHVLTFSLFALHGASMLTNMPPAMIFNIFHMGHFNPRSIASLRSSSSYFRNTINDINLLQNLFMSFETESPIAKAQLLLDTRPEVSTEIVGFFRSLSAMQQRAVFERLCDEHVPMDSMEADFMGRIFYQTNRMDYLPFVEDKMTTKGKETLEMWMENGGDFVPNPDFFDEVLSNMTRTGVLNEQTLVIFMDQYDFWPDLNGTVLTKCDTPHIATVEIVRLLVKYGMDPNFICRTKSAMLRLAKSRKVDKMRTLLNVHADPNLGDRFRLTPLMHAARRGYIAMVHMLLEHGAKINLVSRRGWTALSSAIFEGHVNVFEALLRNGARIDQTGSSSPLMVAARRPELIFTSTILDILTISSPDSLAEQCSGAKYFAEKSENQAILNTLNARCPRNTAVYDAENMPRPYWDLDISDLH